LTGLITRGLKLVLNLNNIFETNKCYITCFLGGGGKAKGKRKKAKCGGRSSGFRVQGFEVMSHERGFRCAF